MRITWITAHHPPGQGGMAVSSARLVNGLRDRGHAVRVIQLGRHAGAPADYHRTALPGLNAPTEPAALFWHERTALADSLLVGFGGGQAGYLAVLWARWLGSRSLVLLRGNDFELGMHDLRRAWLGHFLLQHADGVGAVSLEMAARARAFRTGPVFHTPNALDLTTWQLFEHDRQQAAQWRRQRVPSGQVVAMFGQLKEKKGLELALGLFTSFGFAERATLLTVGQVPEAMAQRLAALGERWIHVPFQARERLPMYYQAADVVLIPSLYDGAPNVLLEAMGLGRIVVGSRAGALPELLREGENGFLFDVAATEQAAWALDRALTLEQREAMGAAAMATIRQQAAPERELRILEQALQELGGPV